MTDIERAIDSAMHISEKMYTLKYTIVFDDKAITGYPDKGEMSLEEVMDIATKSGFANHGVLTVILETARGGTIYQYGNYGDSWVKHGNTNGLA